MKHLAVHRLFSSIVNEAIRGNFTCLKRIKSIKSIKSIKTLNKRLSLRCFLYA